MNKQPFYERYWWIPTALNLITLILLIYRIVIGK